jgi:DUF2911 family protein
MLENVDARTTLFDSSTAPTRSAERFLLARREGTEEGEAMCTAKLASTLFVAMLATSPSFAEEKRPASPRGQSAVEVAGKWQIEKGQDEPRYSGGKWIEVDYGRPIKRGRADLFGVGADYGKKITAGAPVWRAGANQTTKLKTEIGLDLAGKKIAPGEYAVFVDLKEGAWTFILSAQPTQSRYDPKDKKAIWGSYGYDPKYDVARAPMTKVKQDLATEQFTIGFADATDSDVKLVMSWDRETAYVTFKLAK